MQPYVARQRAKDLEELCKAEVDAINIFFPNIQAEDILICFTAWLAFACAMDDILETLPPLDGKAAMSDCIEIMQSRLQPERSLLAPVQKVWDSIISTWHTYWTSQIKADMRIQSLAQLLCEHSARHLSKSSADVFFQTTCRVFSAHMDEISFLQDPSRNDFTTYMTIRSRTIALNPFFEVIKCEFLTSDLQADPILEKLQHDVCYAAGLQNDLIGLERDIEEGELLNGVIVMLREEGRAVHELDQALLARYINQVTQEHNQSIARSLEDVEQIQRSLSSAPKKALNEVIRHILWMGRNHLQWCMAAKRYQVAS